MEEPDQIHLNVKAQSLVDFLIAKLGIQNYTLTITRGNVRGDNYLGFIAKVQVKTASASWNWIVKCAPETTQFRELVPLTTKVYGREVYVYETILAQYQKLQEEKGITTQFRSYAKFHTSLIVEPYETIIMEDMKAMGYKLFNRHNPLDYDHALLVMREYGRFHALSLAVRDQKPDLFREFQQNVPEVFYDMMVDNEGGKKLLQHQCSRVVDYFDTIGNKKAHERLSKFHDNMFEHIKKVLTADTVGSYAVICHGDCWINNLLFKYSDSKPSPTNLCFIDWQMVRVGSPVLDLSYFIFTSTDKKLRDEHYDNLIKEYYHSLSSFLIELGSDPEILFPFHILLEQLKICSVYGLFMALQILYFMVSDVDEIPDIHNFSTEEEALEQMKYVPKNIDIYNTRIKDVVLDFEKFGYDF